MEDIVLVSGVIVLRPTSEDEDDEGITCDGVIRFRPPAGRKKEEIPHNGTYEIVTSSEDDRMIADDGSME